MRQNGPVTSRDDTTAGDAWADRARATARRYLAAWELAPDGDEEVDVEAGDGALVRPVTTPAGEAAALRVSRPRPGTEHEHLALRLWAGRGAVRLLRAEPADRVLLLERTRAEDLHSVPVLEACRVLGELVGALARPPRPPFPPLSGLARGWLAELEGAAELDARFPRRFRLQAVAALRRLLRDDLDAALLPADLHYGAVHAADRAPWLAVQAEPVLAVPEFALVPALRHRTAEAGRGGALAAALEDRLEALALAADADADRLRAWALVRFALAAHRGPDASGLVQLCKAVQRGA